MKKNNVNTFRKMKSEGNKIVMITSYDAVTAAMAHEAGADLILVGDSMANAILGYPNTISLSLEESMFHVQAVRRLHDVELVLFRDDLVPVDPEDGHQCAGAEEPDLPLRVKVRLVVHPLDERFYF